MGRPSKMRSQGPSRVEQGSPQGAAQRGESEPDQGEGGSQRQADTLVLSEPPTWGEGADT